MSWCYQCGVESRPTPAVAWDEDGEPACVGHAVKADRPLNISREALAVPLHNLKQQAGRLTEGMLTPELLEKVREPNDIAKVAKKMFQQPAAAPSPVQTSTKEHDSMTERICAGYNRVCDRKIGEKCETGLCSRCYANQNYHASRPLKAVRPRKATTEPPQIELERTPQDIAKVLEESDPFIVVRLRSSHVTRLLGLILAD